MGFCQQRLGRSAKIISKSRSSEKLWLVYSFTTLNMNTCSKGGCPLGPAWNGRNDLIAFVGPPSRWATCRSFCSK